MKERVLFLGTGVINDGRFNYFYSPFKANGVDCHIVSRFPEKSVFGTQGALANYYVYDYKMDEDRALSDLTKICRQRGISKVMTLFEDAVVLGARLREELGIEGLRYQQAIRFIDKYEMKRRLSENKVPCARFKKITEIGELDEFMQDVGFPFILKPLKLYGTIAVTRVEDKFQAYEAFAKLIARFPEGCLAEEFIAGREMSCDSMVCKGRVVYAAATKYDPSVISTMENKDVGLSVVLLNDLSEDAQSELTSLAQRVVDVMEFKDGFTHMEIFQTPRGYVVGEIAARPPGARIVDLHNISQGINVGTVYYDIMMLSACDYVFNREYSSGVYFITTARQGKISEIKGANFIWNMDGLVECRLPSIGSTVGPKSNSCDDIGYIMLRSKSSEQISRAIAEARKVLQVGIVEEVAA